MPPSFHPCPVLRPLGRRQAEGEQKTGGEKPETARELPEGREKVGELPEGPEHEHGTLQLHQEERGTK